MGVEKNCNETTGTKTNVPNIYRPPPLRNLDAAAAAAAAAPADAENHQHYSIKRSETQTTKQNFAATKHQYHPSNNNATLYVAETTSMSESSSCNNQLRYDNELQKRATERNEPVNSMTSNRIKMNTADTPPTTNDLGTPSNSTTTTTNVVPTQRQTTARRERRPDRAVYIPRARRSQTTPPIQSEIVPNHNNNNNNNDYNNTNNTLPLSSTPSAATTITKSTNAYMSTNTTIHPATAAGGNVNNNNININTSTAYTTSTNTNTNSPTAMSCNPQQLPITTENLDLVLSVGLNKSVDSGDTTENGCDKSISINSTTNTSAINNQNKLVKKTKTLKERKDRTKKSNSKPTTGKNSQLSPEGVVGEAPQTFDRINPAEDNKQLSNRNFCDIETTATFDKDNKQELKQFENNPLESYNGEECPKEIEVQQQHPPSQLSVVSAIIVISSDKNQDQEEEEIPDQNNDDDDFNQNQFANITNMNKTGNKKANTKSGNRATQKPVDMTKWRIEDVAAAQQNDRKSAKCDNDEQELKRASKEINRSNRRIIKQTFVSDVLEIPDKIETLVPEHDGPLKTAPKSTGPSTKSPKNKRIDSTTEEEEEEDDWESMFDESGDCLDPKVMQELTAAVGKVKLQLPQMDYTAFQTKLTLLNEDEFPHVLEVSNFPVEFKNQDLMMVFSQYKQSGFDIKWVDDTHALAVFSSSQVAAEALTMGHPFVKLKPLSEATEESRLKAKRCASSLLPYKPRPETCAALARRLVTGALGVRLKTTAAERENEKRVLREAKERKLLLAKQRDETWES